MTNSALDAHRLFSFTMAAVALITWGAYAYSAHSSATRDQERLEAIARITTDRDALLSAQQRLQHELSLANAQLTAAQQEIALREPEPKVAQKSDRAESPVEGKAAEKQVSQGKRSSELRKLLASGR